eukprot:6250898-Prymnesium_polylepis.2
MGEGKVRGSGQNDGRVLTVRSRDWCGAGGSGIARAARALVRRGGRGRNHRVMGERLRTALCALQRDRRR